MMFVAIRRMRRKGDLLGRLGAGNELAQVLGEFAQFLGRVAAPVQLPDAVCRFGLPGRLAGQSVDEAAKPGADQQVVLMQRQ